MPVVLRVILIEQRIPKPVLLGMPFLGFTTLARLRPLLTAPHNPRDEGIGLVGHGGPPLL
jgi:hypothetical protein